jgi:WD40 repeat protein/beta-lactamase regulating signal transducer with metallopeptidase domain
MISASEWIVTGFLRASAGLSIAALLVAACVRLLRLRAPRAEQWAWLFVLVQGVILLPVPIPIPSRFLKPEAPPGRAEIAPSAIESAQSSDAAHGGMSSPEPAAITPPFAEPRPEPATVRRALDLFSFSWAVAAFASWLGGLVMLLGLAVLRYGSFAGRLRGAHPASPEWQVEWRTVLDEQAVQKPIPLVVSRDAGPALCWLPSGYCLVVPESLWAGLNAAERALILRHELAHYRRRDLWTTLLARCMAVVQWFNPLAWWSVARFEAQSEFICDRSSAADDPVAFAETLLRLGSSHGACVAIVRAARSGSLFERIQRLLGDSPRPARWKCALPIAVALVALGIMAVRLQAVGLSGATDERSNDPTDRVPLPPRAVLRIGTDDLRIRSSFITGIAFSPDGRLIAATEANAPAPRVSLFDVRTGRLAKLVNPPDRPRGWVNCVAFSPDQTKLVWGEISGEVAVWDLARDRLLFREKLHGNEVSDVTFSPDGQIVASGGEDGAVHLRRAADPRDVIQVLATGERQPVGHRAFAGLPAGPLPVGPIHLAFTSDGARLIVGSGSSATISIWRIKDGQLVRRIEHAHGNSRGTSSSLSSVAVTPDGRRILSAGESTVPITQTKLKYGARNVTLTEIRFWDLETGERVKDLQGEEDIGRGYAALSRDGRHVAVGDFGLLRILDATTGRPERTISLPGCWGDRPAFSPDGTLVAMAIYNTIGIFEVGTGRRLHHDERTPEGEFASCAWSPSGDRIGTGHSDGEVRVWEAATGKLLWHKVLAPVISSSGWNARPAFLAFSGDGRLIVAAGRRDDPVAYRNGIVAVYEADTGRTVREVTQKEIRWAALAADGRTVVVATSSGGWGDTHFLGVEVGTGRTRWANPSEDERPGFVQIAGMQFQPNSPFFSASMRDGNVIRFNALTGREQRRFLADGRTPEQQKAGRPRTADLLFTAAFSADGRTMVSSSNEWVCVWDVEAGKLRRRIRYPNDHGCFLTLSPDGKMVATSEVQYAGEFGEDKIRLYDAETGEQVLTLEPVDDRADVLAFSPDGTKLFTGFHRGSALVWDVHRGERASETKK